MLEPTARLRSRGSVAVWTDAPVLRHANRYEGIVGDEVGGTLPEPGLDELLAAIAGVADVSVAGAAGTSPTVRVWLDGTRDAEDVQEDVSAVLQTGGYRARETIVRSTPAPQSQETGPRRGLGRGLESLIPAATDAVVPGQLQGVSRLRSKVPQVRLEAIAIEETVGGVVVRATDSNGRIVTSPVPDESGINAAVAAAVAGLHGFTAAPRIRSVDVRDVAGTSVLIVLVDLADGETLAGASVVTSGMPFTLGRAVWAALEGAE